MGSVKATTILTNTDRVLIIGGSENILKMVQSLEV